MLECVLFTSHLALLQLTLYMVMAHKFASYKVLTSYLSASFFHPATVLDICSWILQMSEIEVMFLISKLRSFLVFPVLMNGPTSTWLLKQKT